MPKHDSNNYMHMGMYVIEVIELKFEVIFNSCHFETAYINIYNRRVMHMNYR